MASTKKFLVTIGESTKPIEVPVPVTTDSLRTVSFSALCLFIANL